MSKYSSLQRAGTLSMDCLGGSKFANRFSFLTNSLDAESPAARAKPAAFRIPAFAGMTVKIGDGGLPLAIRAWFRVAGLPAKPAIRRAP